jgi:two-component system, chemotaxis family, sensor kinase CheA
MSQDRPSDKALQEFLSEAQEIIETFNRDLLALDSQRSVGRYDPEYVNDAFRAVHSLKGLSGLFGIARMTTLSHTLENLLDSLRLGRVSITPEILDLLFEAVELYGRIIADTSAGHPHDTSDIDAYLARIDRAAVRPGVAGGTSGRGSASAGASGTGSGSAALGPAAELVEPTPLAEYVLDPSILSVLTEYEEHRLRENIKFGRTLYRVHAAFDLMSIDKGLEELKIRLKPTGEVITYLPSAEASQDDKIELDVVLASEASRAQVEQAVVGTGAQVSEVARGPGFVKAGGEVASAPAAPAPAAAAVSSSPAMTARRSTPALGPIGEEVVIAAAAASRPLPGASGAGAGGATGASALPGHAHPAGQAATPVASGSTPTSASSSTSPSGTARRDRRASTEPAGDAALAGRELRDAEEAEEDRPSSLKSVSQTVRVDIRKLDHLMNVVGELALARAGIGAILEELRNHREMVELARRLHSESRTLERKLDELQNGILEVRMVPLGQVFDKLSRVVRKISRDAGKDIRLDITGADTELDKLIVEELSDPLMHIIRNSIDHGIETPEARRAAGKPAVGTIAINAQQKGNHVVIEVKDDGAGFDEERILETALRRHILDPATAGEISRRELLNLVFLPGFSTRDVATELSGRGVGLDVVKTNIAKLSGIIDLVSLRGTGTQISITLPITLAIIQALVIRAAGRTYAVPLNSVLESLTITTGDIRTIEGREVISLRGQTLTLSRVEEALHLTRTDGPPDKFYIVVVGLAQHRLGLVVDDLVGQQDIVIKSLGKALADVPGIAGATELGGQQIVLVLDVAALVEESLRGAAEAA